ncbi:MAG TPA: L,D-transpeptidase family protein [Chryseolinea sp.]
MMKSFAKKLVTYAAYITGCIVFVSCSRNLSKLHNLNDATVIRIDSSSLESAPVTVSKSFSIDTLSYGYKSRSLVVAGNPYFSKRVTMKIGHFYKSKAYQTQWLFDQAPSSLYYSVINTLKNADKLGLTPEDYDVSSIEHRLNTVYKDKTGSMTEISDLDIHITEMYFLFTSHLLEGKVRSVGNGRNVWKRQAKTPAMTDVDLLLATTNSIQFEEALKKLQPEDEQYARLQKALSYYQSLARSEHPNLPAISVPRKIAPIESSPAIPLIRKKLSLMDLKVYPMPVDSATGTMDSLYYDAELVYAIKLFQLRHGLEPDGIIGDKTLKFLNQSFKEMANVIAINLDRMRWNSGHYGDNYILVNVPEYKLRVYENHKPELEMKVIVGSAQTATPIFTDVLEHIVFSPTWTVPVSIIKGEIIPNLKANPEHYSNKNFAFFKNNVEIDPAYEPWDSVALNPYEYRVVQSPGPDNSLGQVKFMMPNNLSVYLHDTPNHRLFSKDYRALSHGCVRLAEPARFAEYLLRDQKGWTAERIDKAMNNPTPTTILLKKHYDVHIEYRTAWVDDNGALNLREDIYGHDRVQLSQLLPVVKTPSTLVGME